MELYWILRLPAFHDFLLVISVIFFFISLFSGMGVIILYDEEELNKKNIYVFKISLALTLLFGFVSCLVPDKTELALMMGWDAVKSDSVQEVIDILKEKIK